jgi:hypothetical protein
LEESKVPFSRSQRDTRRTWVDPVLPASCTPGRSSRASGAVPPGSLTTANIPSRTARSIGAGTPSIGASTAWATPPMLRVRCGCTARPPAMRDT